MIGISPITYFINILILHPITLMPSICFHLVLLQFFMILPTSLHLMQFFLPMILHHIHLFLLHLLLFLTHLQLKLQLILMLLRMLLLYHPLLHPYLISLTLIHLLLSLENPPDIIKHLSIFKIIIVILILLLCIPLIGAILFHTPIFLLIMKLSFLKLMT